VRSIRRSVDGIPAAALAAIQDSSTPGGEDGRSRATVKAFTGQPPTLSRITAALHHREKVPGHGFGSRFPRAASYTLMRDFRLGLARLVFRKTYFRF